MKLSVHLITYHGAKYLPYLFESLRAQTFTDWEIIAVENGSRDDTLVVLKKELENLGRPHRLIVNAENRGFAGGHNQALRQMAKGEGQRAEYVLLLNQDTMLSPDYFERLVEFMEGNPEAAATQGVLFRWNFGKKENGPEFSEVVDSMGLRVSRSRHVSDWGAGEVYRKISKGREALAHAHPVEIFGVSGAVPMYRRRALEAVAVDGQIFDEDFFSYKEDVDLAFRLRSAGWRAYLVPAARAWHDRTVAGRLHGNPASFIRERRSRSRSAAGWAYRNHLFTLIKNEYFVNVLKDLPLIVFYEIRKLGFLLFFTPGALAAIPSFFKLLQCMLRKRAEIRKKRTIFAWEMRRWFT